MKALSAIVFIPDDTARLGLDKPLMLQNLLFAPVARWLSRALIKEGVERFFLVCHEQFTEDAVACFPEGVEVVTTASTNPTEQLAAFLTEGSVLVVSRPLLLLKGWSESWEEPGETGLSIIESEELLSAMEGEFDFNTTLAQNGIVLSAMPISSLIELHNAQKAVKEEIIHTHINNGVSFWDPASAFVGPDVAIGSGSVIYPNVMLTGATVIGDNCEIGPNSRIDNCVVSDCCVINASQMFDSSVGKKTKVGPFAYIRPDCKVGEDVKVGDFVELKNSVIGNGTKISHLTYVGDSDLGENVNLGCGTVTVNYDGTSKYRTTVHDGAFVGCNTNLIAPVEIGQNAYVAAGSTITKSVPSQSLAIARSRQTVKPEWVVKRKKKSQSV